MAYLINEKRMVEENLFQFEDRLKSPLSRFLDTTPTFVTYYHLNSDETTTDEGFLDVASIIGFRSPIEFNKITDFPLYGIEQVVLQLQDEDHGLDSSYSGDAVILPNTIKPLQNDFFVIPTLHDAYIFRVTEIAYDAAMPDNFYKISFQLEYIDNEKLTQLDDQVHSSFSCILGNIGTENKCLIESGQLETINKIDEMYNDMVQTYLALFYDERYNCLLGDWDCPIDDKVGCRIYDPFQTEFINKHKLFNKKNDLKTLILTNQYTDKRRRVKYEKSLYRFIERRDTTLVNNFPYILYAGSSEHESAFYRWIDRYVYTLDIPLGSTDNFLVYQMFSNEFVTSIRVNGPTESKHAELIQKYVRKEEITINDIPLNLNEELINLNGSIEVFFYTPIILYIIKEVVNSAIHTENK